MDWQVFVGRRVLLYDRRFDGFWRDCGPNYQKGFTRRVAFDVELGLGRLIETGLQCIGDDADNGAVVALFADGVLAGKRPARRRLIEQHLADFAVPRLSGKVSSSQEWNSHRGAVI